MTDACATLTALSFSGIHRHIKPCRYKGLAVRMQGAVVRLTERDRARLDVAGQADGELRRSEDMQRRRPGGQIVVGRDAPNERALARLAHAKVARVEHAKAHLPIQLCNLMRW